MDNAIALGQRQMVDGRVRVHYYGYWIRAYDVPVDSLRTKKLLIEALTRRLFNHCEHGINVPGRRLAEARRAFDSETDPSRRRVKAAMLAGALFNRATEIFTKLVELQELGVVIDAENALMRECGANLEEALMLGKSVLHRSGEEGLDELWGEPFKAFAFPIEAFYNSRYIKIAQSMQAIDLIRDELLTTFATMPSFDGLSERVVDLARAAREKSETLRTDADVFDVWTSFVVCAEHVASFVPRLSKDATQEDEQRIAIGMRLVLEGKDIISSIARARVPMPKTTRDFVEHCRRCAHRFAPEAARSVA